MSLCYVSQLCHIFSDFCRPPEMCSSMMGALSVDAELMKSLTPEPFMSVRYLCFVVLSFSEDILVSICESFILFYSSCCSLS